MPAASTLEGGRSIRVAVRVRPLLPADGSNADTSLLRLDAARPNEVLLAAATERHTGRRYGFDQVFGPDVSQDEVYAGTGVADMVAAVAGGYHATIFAYGQTGSGKTYTMEGFRYVSAASSGGASGAAAAASAAQAQARGVWRAGGSAGAPPVADFATTPPEQLGIIPRAVRELFDKVASTTDRRFTIRCSFVQIYREQVYDLLNPATLAAAASGGGGAGRRLGGSGVGLAAGGPLRMRWSRAEEFYLENVFMPELESAEEALAAFRAGVAGKAMSAHRLNAASSRSHCLFTLHVASCPAGSPLEARSAKLTLVDLAGSERAALTGATEGALRDESVAINKSLFALRKVITALTDASAAAAAAGATARGAGASAGPTQQQPQPQQHVPYRDSKLTCLLKHSLGGNSLTLMLACLAPADRFLEENASTLDYAARARRITNQVAVNEDPRSHLIRELREEVAFLRQQLQAAGAPAPTAWGGGGAAATTTAALLPAGGGSKPHAAAPSAAASQLPQPLLKHQQAPQQPQQAAGGAQGEENEEAYISRLRAADAEVLVRGVIEATRVAVAASASAAQLRGAYAAVAGALESLTAQHEALAAEDAVLRDKVAMLEALVADSTAGRGAAGQGGEDGGGGGGDAVVPYTAATAALIELEELRRENALLHERLELLQPDPDGGEAQGWGWAGARAASAGGHGGRGGLLGSLASSPGSRRLGSGGSGGARGGGGGGGAAAQSQRRSLQRAQSAGALRATGRRAAAAAAAAAAANPFTPRDLLHAVLPPPPPPTAPGGAARPVSRSASRPTTGAAGGGGAAAARTLTVEQLRSMLHAAEPDSPAASAPAGAASVHPPTNGPREAPPGPSGRPPTSAAPPPGTAGAPGAASSSSSSSVASGRLAEIGHTVASRALGSGLRLSTTGKLLPATPARMAVEAAVGETGGGATGVGGRGEWQGPDGGDGTEAPRGVPEAGSGQGQGVVAGAEAALAQLLAERNALTRQRLAG